MKRRLIALGFTALALLSACSDPPLPENRLDYLGHWRAPEMDLRIMANGEVSYQRLDRSISVAITAPLQSLSKDGFRVGYGLLSMGFDVDEPPHQVHGIWKMTVDDVELTRIDDHEVLESI